MVAETAMERCSIKMDILEKACYLLTTLKNSTFSKVAGPGLQSEASFTKKIYSLKLINLKLYFV